jgi:hypothetical protein
MLYEKLLEVVGIDTFAGENGFWRPIRLHHFFLPLSHHIRSRPSFRSLFILRTMLQLVLGLAQIFVKGLSCVKLLAMSWR